MYKTQGELVFRYQPTMSDFTAKPLVLVVSGTGATGLSVLKGLAKAGAWVSVQSTQIFPND